MIASSFVSPACEPPDHGALHRPASVEWVNGRAVEKRANIESSLVEARVLARLAVEAERSGTAQAFGSSLRYRCYRHDPQMFRNSDGSVIRGERLVGVDLRGGFMPIPADLVVEVISPYTRHNDVVGKVDEYLRNDFGLVWVASPRTRTVHVYRRDGHNSLLHENDEISGESALPGFKCRVGEFFAPRPAPAAG